MSYYKTIDVLLGETLTDIQQSHDQLVFVTDKGKRYKMYHEQDCCESVMIDDINGDLNDLIGSPITQAEETWSHGEKKDEWDDSCTWTFYHLATIKGYVTIKWYGTSNGYYSESVDIVEDGVDPQYL